MAALIAAGAPDELFAPPVDTTERDNFAGPTGRRMPLKLSCEDAAVAWLTPLLTDERRLVGEPAAVPVVAVAARAALTALADNEDALFLTATGCCCARLLANDDEASEQLDRVVAPLLNKLLRLAERCASGALAPLDIFAPADF